MQVTRVPPDCPVPSLRRRRPVIGDRIMYVGPDIQKGGIVVALAEGGLQAIPKGQIEAADAFGNVSTYLFRGLEGVVAGQARPKSKPGRLIFLFSGRKTFPG